MASPRAIERSIDIDRLCEEERIRRLGERIRRDRDDGSELSRERRARGLARELRVSGLPSLAAANVAADEVISAQPSRADRADASVSSAHLIREVPFSVAATALGARVAALEEDSATKVPVIASDARYASPTLPTFGTPPKAAPTGPANSFTPGAGFSLSWASALAEDDSNPVMPSTSAQSSSIYRFSAGSSPVPPAQTYVPQRSTSGSPPAYLSQRKTDHRSPSGGRTAAGRNAFGAPARRAASPRDIAKHIKVETAELTMPLTVQEMEDQQRQLQETQKEMREIRALESQIKWSLEREEKKQVQNEKKEADLEIMEWREELAINMREAAEERAREQREQDLRESKDYQDFKRDRKQVLKEEELQLIKEQYQADVEHSQMQAEIAKTAVVDRHAIVLENLEDIQVVRDYKQNERLKEKVAVEQERSAERRLNFAHQSKQLRDQKEELLRNLQLMRSAQKQTVETSGRAGRSRAMKTRH